MVTIKDVAKKASVSVATVSRVLNDSEKVNETTRARVLLAMQQLGYRPNLLGRNLRLAQTQRILVILPTISNQFYSKIVTGIEEQAAEFGYSIMLCATHADAENEKKYIDLLTNRSVDGAIFLASQMSSLFLSDLAMRFPIVQCCEYLEETNISTVSIDNQRAAFEAVEYLIRQGHRRIAMVGCDNNYASSKYRLQGYLQALSQYNIPIRDEYLFMGNYTFDDGKKACDQLMQLDPAPTAVFTIADTLAIGFTKALQAYRLQAGKDIAVIGFDDTSIAAFYTPSLTTVAQPRYELGKCATNLLIDKIRNTTCESQFIILPHELKVRESA